MIEAKCFTNLDEYKQEKWPKYFVALPKEKQRVQSKSGKILIIVGITHCIRNANPNFLNSNSNDQPYIEVELNKLLF